jgi:hypothetical protein
MEHHAPEHAADAPHELVTFSHVTFSEIAWQAWDGADNL